MNSNMEPNKFDTLPDSIFLSQGGKPNLSKKDLGENIPSFEELGAQQRINYSPASSKWPNLIPQMEVT